MNDRDTLTRTLAHYAELTAAAAERLLAPCTDPPDFYGMLRYHLGQADQEFRPLAAPRGKGLRAGLLLLVASACGGDEQDAVPLAVAIELLHNFSLIHDDIEDGSTLRRHRPTVWSLWGVPLAVNAGDGLFSLAHLALYGAPLRRHDPERFITLSAELERTILYICEGQHRDMTFERRASVTVAEYLTMIDGKTAALVGTAARLGAHAARATVAQTDAAERFGRALGLAFQMQDDILGIWGDEALTGKSASSDLASRKKTLPVLLAMERATPALRERLLTFYTPATDLAAADQAHQISATTPHTPPQSDETIAEIMAILESVDARERTERYLREHWSSALTAIEQITPEPAARDRLRAVAELFVARSA